MRSMFSTLELAKRALQAQRAALDVTAHNIANANTPGYTRQVPRIVTTNPYTIPELNTSVSSGQAGTGARLETINRIRDQFLDFQYRGEARLLGEWQEMEARLSRIETIFNEPSENSLRSVMDSFFNAWQELVKDPQTLSPRSLVRQASKALASAFSQNNKLLVQTIENTEADLEMNISEVNSIARQIADLNDRIAVAQLGGNQPNDLLDQRDYLIDQLSEMGNVRVQEISRGDGIDNLKISFVGSVEVDTDSDGTLETIDVEWVLVNDREAHTITKESDAYYVYDSEGNITATYDESLGVIPTAELKLNDSISGRLGGIQKAKEIVEQYKEQLDKLGLEIVEAVNEQAREGYATAADGTIDEFTDLLPAGERKLFFFNKNDPDNYMYFNPLLEGETGLGYLPAAAGVLDAGGNLVAPDAINGENALAIAKIRERDFTDLGNTNVIDFYNSLIAQLGVETQESKRLVNSQELLVNQIDQHRQSISSVSVDEEMTNMIKYQHAYNAAARMVTAFDEMIDMVVNRMGLVGR